MKRKPITASQLLQHRQMARLTRRQFIKRMAGAGMMLGMPPLLLSCGGSSDSPTPPPFHREAHPVFQPCSRKAGERNVFSDWWRPQIFFQQHGRRAPCAGAGPARQCFPARHP
jgi:hypothetical protein